jgi:hypothetical protein
VRLRLLLAGAALAYFFDPQHGHERRRALAERLARLRGASGPRDLSDELVEQAHSAAASPR